MQGVVPPVLKVQVPGYAPVECGLEAKAGVTMRFLRAKLDEYERLTADIDRIRAEVAGRKNP